MLKLGVIPRLYDVGLFDHFLSENEPRGTEGDAFVSLFPCVLLIYSVMGGGERR